MRIAPLRIALVSEHASPLAALGGADAGGQNVHVAELACGLAGAGHEVVVYTRRTDPDLPDRVTVGNRVTVENLTAGPAREIAKDELLPHVGELAEQLAKGLGDFEPDVVHAHFWMSGLAALAARPDGVPVVQTFHALGSVKQRHQGALDTSPDSRIEHERRIAREADRIVASCSDELAELVALGAPAAHIDVVPSGVDLAAFRPDGPAAPRSSRPRLLSIGRLVPRKGVEDTLRALALVPDAELVVAGGPPKLQLDADPEGRRLIALADELGISERVRFVGSVPQRELPAVLRSSDLVVCLPWYEPFGIVPLEAMACGVPVVASAVGGMLDTVADGRTGRLVPPHDPQAAAAAISELLADPAARATYGTAARQRAESYGWDDLAVRTERTYRQALDDRRARSTPGGDA